MAQKLYDLASSNVSEHLAYLEKDPRGPKRQDGDRSFLVMGLLFRKISNSMSVWLGAYFMQVIVVWLILFTCLSIDKACQVLYKTMSIEILEWCIAFPDKLLSMIAVRSMISLLSWLTVKQRLQNRRGRLLRRKWLSWPANRRRPSKTSQGSQVSSFACAKSRSETNMSGTGPAPITQVHIGPKHGGVGKCVPFPRGFVFQILSQLIFASRLWGRTRRSVVFKYLWINMNSALDLNTCMILKSSVFRQPRIDGSSCHVPLTRSHVWSSLQAKGLGTNRAGSLGWNKWEGCMLRVALCRTIEIIE